MRQRPRRKLNQRGRMAHQPSLAEQKTLRKQHRLLTCRWCEQPYKVNYGNRGRKYCYKPECEQRQWLWTLLHRYNRCKNCKSIIPKGKTEWGSYNYCPFCIGSIKKEIRQHYVDWLRKQPRYVEALLPNPMILLKNAKEYVKTYNINNLKFQTYYPNQQNQHY